MNAYGVGIPPGVHTIDTGRPLLSTPVTYIEGAPRTNGADNALVAVVETTTGNAWHVKNGGWRSCTVTVKLQTAVLPDVSSAVQTIVLFPIPRAAGEESEHEG